MSKMYRCVECGHLFEEGEQETWNEDRGEYFGAPCSEKLSGCPVCEGAYEPVEPCKICGRYEDIEEDEILCENCKKETEEKLIKLLHDNFTVEERELLNTIWEDVEF